MYLIMLSKACGTLSIEKINVYKILVIKHEVKRTLWGRRHRWEDNIKMEYGLYGFIGTSASGEIL
jgi:hypothetical protein